MQAEVPTHRIEMDATALARFMPMHLLLDNDGRAVSYGPTLSLVLREADGKRTVMDVRYNDLLKGGSLDTNVVLRAGDTVLVP